MDLLQRLRDEFMPYLAHNVLENNMSNNTQDVDDSAFIALLFPSGIYKNSKPTNKLKLLQNVANDTKKANTKSVNEIPDSAHATYSTIRKEVELVRSLRRIVSLPLPVQLETIPSASNLLRALDKIFRTYVRGTALPGQLAGGNTVEFDGNTLTFRNFILRGPYMSWKGFVHFLLDFAIAAPPQLHTKLGASFHAEVLGGKPSKRLSALNDNARSSHSNHPVDGNNATVAFVAPLTMQEAAVLFIECSKSITPALVLTKFLNVYSELANALSAAAAASTTEGGGGGCYEPWQSVMAWAQDIQRSDWDIKSGINFMQFVDCLGVSNYSITTDVPATIYH